MSGLCQVLAEVSLDESFPVSGLCQVLAEVSLDESRSL